jgi:hypothetical protein
VFPLKTMPLRAQDIFFYHSNQTKGRARQKNGGILDAAHWDDRMV